MGFYLSQKAKFLIPIIPVSGFCRSTGPVDRARSRSTESVDRCAQNVHARSAGGPVDRPGRPSRELCSLEMPRSGRSTDRESALCSRGSVDRPVDRSPNGRISDRWRSTGRSTVSSVWPITASFWSPINWAIWGLFYTIFEVDFSTLSRGFLHLFESKYFQSKGEFIKSVLKVIFLSFPPPFQS